MMNYVQVSVQSATYPLSRSHTTRFAPLLFNRSYIVDVSQKTSILLDPTYTGKAARGLLALINEPLDTTQLAGRRVLFLHTGSVFAPVRSLPACGL